MKPNRKLRNKRRIDNIRKLGDIEALKIIGAIFGRRYFKMTHFLDRKFSSKAIDKILYYRTNGLSVKLKENKPKSRPIPKFLKGGVFVKRDGLRVIADGNTGEVILGNKGKEYKIQ